MNQPSTCGMTRRGPHFASKGHETRGMGWWWGVLHPNAAAAEAAPRVYKLAFRVGSAALEAA